MTDTGILGNGKTGKRLWIRTPDNRWAPVPTGAGEDQSVRSFNVWDGKKWQTCTYFVPLYLRPDDYGNDKYNSLEVYAPGRNWHYGTGDFNPGTDVQRNTPNWIRLFWLAPRKDPNWRMTQMCGAWPTETSSVSIQPQRFWFWPQGATHDHEIFVRGEHVETFDSSYGLGGAPIGTAGLVMCRVGHDDRVAYIPPAGGQSPQQIEFHDDVYSTGMYDLNAIRQRMHDEFAERDFWYNNQYTHIDQMKIKRIVLHGSAFHYMSVIGTAPTLEHPSVTVRVQRGAPGILRPSGISVPGATKSYQARYPAQWDSTVGETIYSHTLSDNGTATQPLYGYPGWYETAGFDTLDWTYVVENPGEDNISFFAELDRGHPHGPEQVSTHSQLSFSVSSCVIHWAVDGKDTPVEYHHTWNTDGVNYFIN